MNIMTKRGNLDNVITYEHYCDTVADLSNIPLSQTTLGSVAIVVNDEDDGMGIYIANSQKEWTPISTSIGGGSGEVLLDLIHVCSNNEYDSVTKVPTIEDAESNKIYLVPNNESGNNAFDEWIYADEAWEKFGEGNINVPVTDVQVNGVSVVTDGVANVPVASETGFGAIKLSTQYATGLTLDSSGYLKISGAVGSEIKAGISYVRPIVAAFQHAAAFYGLAKAAGADLKDVSDVTVGTYPDSAKAAIRAMLGIGDASPNNYAFDGRDLSTVFASAAAFHTALAAGDFSKIRVGDYWPLSLSGTFRDYGAYTVPSGTAYFTDAALTTQGGTTSAKIEGQYESATAVKFKVSGTDVYCAIGDCLDYFERTCNNAIVNLEVAGINNYWRYGDSGDLSGSKSHITFVSRDCLPFTMRMRKANMVWENTEETNPWRGSALFRTLNDPDYGVVKLIAATTIGAYMYAGPNGGGMRAMMEVKASGAPTASNWAWADRGKLFLPFESEIWGHTIWGGTGYTMACGLQLPIFAGTRRHISKGIGNGASRTYWWAASSFSGNAALFCHVNNGGCPSSNGAVGAHGAPVCFVMI